MSLSPRLSVTLGRKRYDSHVVRCRVELGVLPAVNAAELVFPRGVSIEAGPGDPAVLEMDGGEGAETVLTGAVAQVRRGAEETVVTLADAGAALARLRPAATFRGVSFAEVVGRLAAMAGVGVGELVEGGDAPVTIVHQGRTAAEWVAWLAELDGALATVDGEGLLSLRPRGDRAEAALKYGREPVRLATDEREPGTTRLRIGAGAAGNGGAPDALVPTTEPLPVGEAPGADCRWTPTPILRTASAAQGASSAASAAAAAEAGQLDAGTFLLPALRPGQVVEVQSLPGGLSEGPWLLLGVRHRLDARGGGETRLQGVSAGGGLGGLLGAVAGALL